MYYQTPPPAEYYFKKKSLGSWAIPTHFHSFFELLCCEEGPFCPVIAGRTYTLQAGEAVLIFPYQPHSFPTGGSGCLFTFEPELISAFAAKYANFLPVDNRFSFPPDRLQIDETSSLFSIKAFLYDMCDRADTLRYTYAPAEGRALLEKIFLLTESHYRDPAFSLERLSGLLDYDYSYVSKYFFQKTGMRYSYYLTQRRITAAAKMLQKEPAVTICDVAAACGYGSIRSFNRNFRRLYGVSPGEYGR